MPIFFGENFDSPLTDAAKSFLAEEIGALEPISWKIQPTLDESKKLSDPDRLYVWLLCVSFLWYVPNGNGTGEAQTLLTRVLGEIPLLPQAERPALYNRCAAIFEYDLEDFEAALSLLERDDNIPDYSCVDSCIYWQLSRSYLYREDYERMLTVMRKCRDEEAYDELIELLVCRRAIEPAIRLAGQFKMEWVDRCMLPWDRLVTTLKETDQQEKISEVVEKLKALGMEVNLDRWS